ncbi:phage tail protein [Chromobacterium haemolyticum]|uniref:phage tail protein n=1 Tax=Chromobacterium haemolyticum TaxID=394935 RepID=UPI0005BD4671|nr:phage tail protein [Chromobacterium haemolyticum]BBH14532.1 hypothetical protein CH06BL_37800 [Chromobacterium haemolyticum]
MNKPHTLRAALEAALPELRHNPDRLTMWTEDGQLAIRPGALHFTLHYTLKLVVIEYGRGIESILLPLLDWIAINEPPLLQNPDARADGLSYRSEIISHSAEDIEITVKLSERVKAVKDAAGGFAFEYLGEPEDPPGMF